MLIKVALSIIALTIIGRSCLRLLLRFSKGSHSLEMKWVETLALSWLIGAGVLGWMAHIALLITGRVYGLLWILFGVVVLIDAAFNYRKILSFIPSLYAGSSLAQEKSLSVLHKKLFGSKDSLKDRWMSLAALGPLAFLVLKIAGLVISSLSFSRGWDGAIIWDMKAKAIYSDSASQPGALMAYFNSPPSVYPHQDYPLLLPTSEAWVYYWADTSDQQALKLIGPMFMIALLALLATRLREILPAPLALLFACLPATAPFLFTHARTGYADIPLAAMSCAAAAYGADYLRKKTSSSLSLWLLFTAFAMLIKKEGTLIGVIMIIAMSITLIFARKSRDLPRILLKVICIISVIAGPWFLFLLVHKIPGGDFAPLSWEVFTANFRRFIEVITYLPNLLSDKLLYGRLWLIASITVLIGAPRWNRPQVIFLGLICFGYLTAISAIFIFSAWQPYWTHVESSITRLIIHVTPIAVLFAGNAFEDKG